MLYALNLIIISPYFSPENNIFTVPYPPSANVIDEGSQKRVEWMRKNMPYDLGTKAEDDAEASN